VGGAVVRNRVRRRVREAARTRYDRLAMGWDLVFVARSGAASAAGAEIGQAVESLLNRAGLLGV
jgi:ribonuclease P protein component